MERKIPKKMLGKSICIKDQAKGLLCQQLAFILGKKLHINILCVPLLGGSFFNSDMPVDRNVILQRDLKDWDYMHFITLIICWIK